MHMPPVGLPRLVAGDVAVADARDRRGAFDPEADIEVAVRTIEAFYKVMYERRNLIDQQ